MNPAQSQFESGQQRREASPYAPQFHPSEDILDYLRAYAREKPEVAALWCFGIGFVLGWKLKPW
ncbi:MAG: hypothetical protein KY475_12340 [Planctomycetes bacterium]|nr:hypothetical protein [Planctomycetota bacterium]